VLFLLNHTIFDLEAPEALLLERWPAIGCGDPACLPVHKAVDFVTERFRQLADQPVAEQAERLKELAALIVTKTGANSLTFRLTASGQSEPRLQDLPYPVLQTYLRGAANDENTDRKAAI